MDIILKKLTPELITDYLDFFDNRAHPGMSSLICYCTAFNLSKEQFNLEIVEVVKATKGIGSPHSVHRKVAGQLIKDNKLKGYLAYHNGLSIGWCNTNDKNKYSQLEFKYNSEDNSDKDSKVQAIACIAIAPEYRDKGVDTKLINRVCEDAKIRGYEIVEAYPSSLDSPYASSCMYLFKKNATGCYSDPIQMYKNAGFVIVSENEKYITMQKKLY